MRVLLPLIIVILTAHAFPATIYVDANAAGANNGSSWADAYGDLQDALDVVDPCDEIWVAAGTYKPSEFIDPCDPRTATFQMKNEVAIYGGFAGNEPNTFDINDRNLATNETILSGDIGIENDANDNCYHVFFHLYGIGLDASALLDGFTITAGNANGFWPYGSGGGMCNDGSSPTVTNCTFTGNSADLFGGGMYNFGSKSSPTVTNCTFTGNSADSGGGMFNYNSSSPTVTNCTFTGNSADFGGGMSNEFFSSPTVTGCTFIGNSASRGGGMSNYRDSSPTVTNCTFTGNSADLDGGGMYNNRSNPTVTNCTFSGNSTGRNGGGMYNNLSSPTVSNCILSGNSTKRGGGMYNSGSSPTVTNCTLSGNSADEHGGGMGNYYSSSPTVSNCILWGNAAASDGNEIALVFSSTIDVNYCDIKDGNDGIYNGGTGTVNWGSGNIDADPCFVNPGYWDPNGTPADTNDDFWVDGDYHLKSEGWRWDSERELWTWDDVTSRCIDAGNPGSPLADEPLTIADDPDNQWGHNLRINMGAYGGTSEASMAPYDWALLCDINNDGTVDFADLAWFAFLWPQSGDELFADFNRNTIVDTNDLEMFTEDWLKQTSWAQP